MIAHPIRAGVTRADLPRALPRQEAGRVALAWVPEERIDPKVRDRARRHVRRLTRVMGFDRPPTIRWFGPPVGRVDFTAEAPAPDCLPLGYSPRDLPHTIGLLKGIDGLQLAEVIGHECWHLAERQRGRLLPDHEDAYAFGRAYAADLEDPET